MKRLFSLSVLLLILSLFTACGDNETVNPLYKEESSQKIEEPKSNEATMTELDISTSIVKSENSNTRDDDLPYSDYNISVINQSKKVDIISNDELLAIIEKSLNDNKKVLNLKLSMDEVKKAEENSLVITVEYEPAKILYVKGAKQEFSVSRIFLMMYDNSNYFVVTSLENGSVTMNIPSNIIDKINEFFYTDNNENVSDNFTGDDTDMVIKKATLPKEAEIALLEHLKCDSIDALADSVLPSSVAGEMKNGKLEQANYFFAGFPFNSYTDEEILECTLMPKEQAANVAEFLAKAVSLQGVPANFKAEEGFDVVVSATFQMDTEDGIKLRATKRIIILKIIDDRWIVFPTADLETGKLEIINWVFVNENVTI